MNVLGNGDLANQLREAIHRLLEFAPLQATPEFGQQSRRSLGEGGFSPPPPERHVTEGSFFVAENKAICQSLDGEAVPVVHGGTPLKSDGTLTGKCIAAERRLAGVRS